MSKLYPEFSGEVAEWKTPQLPPLDEKLMKRLSAINTVDGRARFRIVDASREQEFLEAGAGLDKSGWFLKYPFMLNAQTLKGWKYFQGGVELRVKRPDQVPKSATCFPVYETRDFGIPRYVVEVYRKVGEPNVRETGYVYAWTCEVTEVIEIAGKQIEVSHYRHPDNKDLIIARKLLSLIETMSKEDIWQAVKKNAEKVKNHLRTQRPLMGDSRILN